MRTEKKSDADIPAQQPPKRGAQSQRENAVDEPPPEGGELFEEVPPHEADDTVGQAHLDENGDPYQSPSLSGDDRADQASPEHIHDEHIDRARAAWLPVTLEPQLATLVDAPPTHDDWLYEIKYDGYRMLARIAQGKVKIVTRNGQDWIDRLPEIAHALLALPVSEAWLDGELAVTDAEGKSDFQRLQRALSGPGSGIGMAYYLFDLLYVDGESLLTTPLHERKERLRALLDARPSSVLQFSAHVEGHGPLIFEQACMHGHEGLIGKRRNSTYTAGRSRTWIKLKCRGRQEFVVGGYTDAENARGGPGALLLGLHDARGRLQYVGKVTLGADHAQLSDLENRMTALKRRAAPFSQAPRGPEGRRAHWVEPTLVAEVSFTGWTADRMVRQACFEGLREDKPAVAVTRERAEPISGNGSTAVQRGRISATTVAVAGVSITHAGRVIFPSVGLTKLDIAHYYESMSEWLLAHLRNRPLAMVRCPSGAEAGCFFQKHLHEALAPELHTIEIEQAKGPGTYVVVESVPALMRLVQIGVLELHTWGSSVGTLERPDRMVLDLDPDPELPWHRIVEAAHLTRALLQALGLDAFAKTTGGKGVHIAVPLARSHTWDEVSGFARAIAEHMAQVLPGQFTANVSKAQRPGRIFVDYLRNQRGATAVAAYSVRARPGAPVSMPLAWEEIAANMPPDRLNVRTVPAWVQGRRLDPWAEYWNRHYSLSDEMTERLRGLL
jgi:bifunctional non-homologous end joining protein LigD